MQGPNYDTVQGFLNNPAPGYAADGLSPLALRAKAAALFERATRVAAQNTPAYSSGSPARLGCRTRRGRRETRAPLLI